MFRHKSAIIREYTPSLKPVAVKQIIHTDILHMLDHAAVTIYKHTRCMEFCFLEAIY